MLPPWGLSTLNDICSISLNKLAYTLNQKSASLKIAPSLKSKFKNLFLKNF